MPATAAPAPAAAAPAAPASPAPAAPASRETHVTPPAESADSGWLDEVGSDIETFDRTGVQPENRPRKTDRQLPRGTEADPGNEPPPGDEADPDGVPAQVPPAKPKPAAAPAAPPVDDSKLPVPQLRKTYAELKNRVNTELEPEIQRLRAQVKTLEERPAADTEQTKTKLSDYEKRIAEQEAHIRFVDYQNSEEYLTKYWQPYQDAWGSALADMKELQVENADGSTRQATEADIHHLASLALGERRKQANAMFGDSADDVMAHVRKIMELSQAQTKALTDAKANSAKKAEADKAAAESTRVARVATWQRQNEGLATKYPDWFAKKADDPAGNTLLEKGFTLTDLLFGEVKEPQWALLPKSFQEELRANGGKLSPEGRIRLHAVIRNKAAAFDRLALQLKEARAELAEAKKTLGEYEQSEPPVGGATPRQGAPAVGSVDEANAELDALDRASGR